MEGGLHYLLHPLVHCSYSNLSRFHFKTWNALSDPNFIGFGTFPDVNLFATPWAATEWKWHYPRELNSVLDEKLKNRQDDLANTWLANLTLFPAPGEMFSIQGSLADAFLQYTTGAATVQVGPWL